MRSCNFTYSCSRRFVLAKKPRSSRERVHGKTCVWCERNRTCAFHLQQIKKRNSKNFKFVKPIKTDEQHIKIRINMTNSILNVFLNVLQRLI